MSARDAVPFGGTAGVHEELRMFDVNFLAVAVAASTFFFGGLWYAPFAFGRVWAAEAGVLAPGEAPRPGARAGKPPGGVFAFAIVFSFLGAWAVAWLAGPHPSLTSALRVGATAGFGVAATSFGINYQFAAHSWRLYAIDAGFCGVMFTLFGLVIGLFG